MEKTTRRLPIVERDEWLLPAEQELNRRYERYTDKINAIEQAAGSIVDYANGYRYFGWQRDELLDGWWLREWLPGAHDVYVFGDFNNWQRTEIRMQRDAHGVWSAFFPEAMYRDRLRHGSLYKLHVHGDNGWKDRIPAYATRVVQDEATKNYTAQFWAPEPFDWQGDAFDASKNGSLMIYEAHVGMPTTSATSTKASTSWTAPTTTTRCPARPVTSPTGTRSSSTTARTRYSISCCRTSSIGSTSSISTATASTA